jgi:argininosuccinate lyase
MKLWGGNYAEQPDRRFWELNRSFPFDCRLLPEEVAASRAYVRALGRCGALGDDHTAALVEGLEELLEAARKDPSSVTGDHEDVHSFVETWLTKRLGDLAGQAHLARSRNEQSVVALRLFARQSIDRLKAELAALVEVLATQGTAAADAIMPGFTHMRPAEPITFGHLAAAHAWALVRDHERLREARRRIDVLPLGSGALAGTPLPLDREAIARELGFAAVSENALDAVTDRDFAAELAFCCAQLQSHLSRLAADLLAFSAPEHAFLKLPEAFTSGSSLMPQKKNPDALELVRGKAARVSSDLQCLLGLMKGLPAGYQKDLQEDKEALFDAVDTAEASVAVMRGVVEGLEIDRDAMRRAATSEQMMAAGIAVALAREGMPFRRAHSLVGSLVAEAEKAGQSLREVAARRLPEHSGAVVEKLDALLDPEQVVRSRSARGGTAPEAVRASLTTALERLKG